MKSLSALGYAHHDERTNMVWVVRYLAYQFSDELKLEDNRVRMLNKQWVSQPWSPHVLPFWRLYGRSHHLEARADLDREAPCQGASPDLFKALDKPLGKGLHSTVENPHASASASASASTSTLTSAETKGLRPAPAPPASLAASQPSPPPSPEDPRPKTPDPRPPKAVPDEWWQQLLRTYPRVERPASGLTELLGVMTHAPNSRWPALRCEIMAGAEVLQRYAAGVPHEESRFLLELRNWIKEQGWKGTDPNDGEETWRDNLRRAGER
jgi:hypothetical protein